MKMRQVASASIRRRCFPFALVILIMFVLCGNPSCQEATTTGQELRPCLVVVPGGTDIKSIRYHGEDQLSYLVQSQYPADDVLHAIGSQLAKTGWKPLKEDYLNPGLASSQVRGFQYFPDLTTHPKSSARRWVGQWENGAHDIVNYMLEYRCTEDLCSSTRDLHDLHVSAIYIPAELRSR